MSRLYIATGNPDISENRLRLLSYFSKPSIRRRVAEHRNTPIDVLCRLARDPNSDVRIAVGLNCRTPDHILYDLASDSCPDVRYMLAASAHTPLRVLKLLLDDSSPYIQWRAKKTISRLEKERIIHLIDHARKSSN